MHTRAAADGDRCTVTVCRGCCCGSTELHPEVDHAGLVADLGDRLDSRASLRVTGCLWVCGAANVIVVSPSAGARRSGARPVWFARILGPEENAAIASWVHAGGPGRVPLPKLLEQHLTLPFRRRRKQVGLTSPDA